MKKQMKKSGFTLVEIMIVVAIIGLLAAIGIPSFQRARANSIEKSMENNARMVAGGVEQFALENALASGDTVGQGDVEVYLKAGWAGLNVGGNNAATFAGGTVGYYTNDVATIAGAMYTKYGSL